MQENIDKRDALLVKQAQKGDVQATEEILTRYKDTVRARARRFFLVGGETEDLVQEGMVGLYFAIRNFSDEAGKSFKNYAYLCVNARICDAVRKMTSQKHVMLNSSLSLSDPDVSEEICLAQSPEEFLIHDEADREFRNKLLKVLSDFEFRVMTLYLDGMSYADICETTGKSFKSVDDALTRSKRKLRKTFEK